MSIVTELEAENQERVGAQWLERVLTFLDTMSVTGTDGSVSTNVYPKETHTEQYSNFWSNHLLEHKYRVMKILLNCADMFVSKDSEKVKELEHISSMLGMKGCPD